MALKPEDLKPVVQDILNRADSLVGLMPRLSDEVAKKKLFQIGWELMILAAMEQGCTVDEIKQMVLEAQAKREEMRNAKNANKHRFN